VLARAPVRELSGWGRTAPTGADVRRPTSATELRRALPTTAQRGLLGRGLGRGYGDCAQNSGGTVVETTDVDAFTIHDDDPTLDHGVVTAEAGASIDRLLHALVPQGLFVPVTPGTRYVTSGEVVEVGPDRDPELFWATAGGMGLTGVVQDVTFRCPRIGSSRLLVDTDRASDLDEVLALMSSGDDEYDYSVAWIDLMASGRSMGRSVLTRGRFATAAEAAPAGPDPLAYEAGVLATAPPVFPGGALNRLTVRAFNEVWFRKAPARRRDELQTIPAFFHPLDMVGSWNRVYGPRGFLQWQFVVPFGAEDALRRIVAELSRHGCTSFLAVLKAFGPGDPGPLSFPAPGWTLALDIPVGSATLGALLDDLDDVVAAAGGRVYLAKDSRMRHELVRTMYPRLDDWRAVRERVDPDRRLTSDLARRLGL
jgi:decaprenylphospho-beta-D-ribofuranose 2-oxidase